MADKPQASSPQASPQLAQLLAERENAEAYGQTTRLEAVDKQLDELGYKREKPKAAEKASEERKAAAKDDEKPSERVPQGRATRQEQQHTAEKKAD